MASGHIGTGGGLRYLTEVADPRMVCQELSHSCQVACVRQILRDAGIEISEAELRLRAGYVTGFGTASEFAAQVLDELHPTLGYNGGVLLDAERNVEILFGRDPWIASVLTDYGSIHAVIVDGREDDVVHLRDPWGVAGFGAESGSRSTILIADFMNHWDATSNLCVNPTRRKQAK